MKTYREMELMFEEFLAGLISSVADYSYEQETPAKPTPDVDEIVKRQYMSVERYCDRYFRKLIEEPAEEFQDLFIRILPAVYNLLVRLESLVSWDTNEFHIKNEIDEKQLDADCGSTAQLFLLYKSVADKLTMGIFEADKQTIRELWEKVIKSV